MEENKVERDLMSEEEFSEHIKEKNPYYIFENFGLLSLTDFYAVRKFKSVRRAIRRDRCTPTGVIIPIRPFHNKANTSRRKGCHSRKINEIKKIVYGRYLQSRKSGRV